MKWGVVAGSLLQHIFWALTHLTEYQRCVRLCVSSLTCFDHSRQWTFDLIWLWRIELQRINLIIKSILFETHHSSLSSTIFKIDTQWIAHVLSLDFAGHRDSGRSHPDEDAHVDISHKHSCLSPPLSFPSCSRFVSFRLSTTFPCHGILKVVYMCMSNAMNMDVTSFFGASPPACPLAGCPPRRKTPLLNEHSVHRRQAFIPAKRTHSIDLHSWSQTHAQTYIHIHARTCARSSLALSCSCFFILPCISSLTFHNVFYIKIREDEGGEGLKSEVKGGSWFLIHICLYWDNGLQPVSLRPGVQAS